MKNGAVPKMAPCQRCGKQQRRFFVVVRAAVTLDAELCTRCTNKILAQYPQSEAAQLIETKAGAN